MTATTVTVFYFQGPQGQRGEQGNPGPQGRMVSKLIYYYCYFNHTNTGENIENSFIIVIIIVTQIYTSSYKVIFKKKKRIGRLFDRSRLLGLIR